MAFNNWPYTNFQDLNLGWILNKIKEAITGSAAAVAKANTVEAEVSTYSERITDAETDAETARTIAYSVQADVVNAQSDATSAIAIGQAAQSTANAATTTANNAMSIANGAADSAELAVDSATDAARDAAVAVQLANLANDDYVNVGITVFPSNPVQATKNADEILAAVTANKKIKFTLDDSRTGDTHATYEYTIDPVENTASDIDINVIFDISVSSSLNKYIVVTFHKVVSGGNTTYSVTSMDVSFSGGGGGGSGDFVLLRMNANGQVYNGTTAITGTQINTLAATNKALFLWDEDNERLYTYTEQGTSAGQLDGTAEFVSPLSNGNGCYLIVVNAANNNSTFYENNAPFQTPRVAMASTDTTPTLDPNKLYVFPEIATLTPMLATPSNNNIENEYHFIFNSGSTPTTLTLPNTIRQPDGFTVEANHVYEVSILENNMTAQGWAVTP